MKKKWLRLGLATALIVAVLGLCGCADRAGVSDDGSSTAKTEQSAETKSDTSHEEKTSQKQSDAKSKVKKSEKSSNKTGSKSTSSTKKQSKNKNKSKSILSQVQPFSGNPYVVINENIPDFPKKDLKKKSFEKYSPLDNLGRCGVAYANVGRNLMPDEERGSIGSVKPSGWQTVKYDCVEGKYLYNRCHLIGYQLTAENANERNLITGTRYLNIEGMLPFENLVADYVKETGNHVLYRVTPVFEGDNLVASGVHMEAQSVEDNGSGIMFNIYAYNNQPGIKINYSNGESKLRGAKANSSSSSKSGNSESRSTSAKSNGTNTKQVFIINTNTGKFHRPDCSSAKDTKPENKKRVKTTSKELIKENYEPCGRCNPQY